MFRLMFKWGVMERGDNRRAIDSLEGSRSRIAAILEYMIFERTLIFLIYTIFHLLQDGCVEYTRYPKLLAGVLALD